MGICAFCGSDEPQNVHLCAVDGVEGLDFSSQKKLSGVHPELAGVIREVSRLIKIKVTEGHRSRERQEALFESARTKAAGNSLLAFHCYTPARAVDICPWPVDWKDREQFTLMAGIVLGVAFRLNVPIVWGGDWNRDFKVRDNKFDDLCHFQLKRAVDL